MIKKLIFLTGTRADYGKIKPLIKALNKFRKYKIFILVTGMHLSKRYGSTYQEIEKDFPKISIKKFKNLNSKDSADITLSKTINSINKIILKIKPDLMILHGDRLETLAASIVGSFNKFLIAHIEGGEVSGTLDEAVRHAVSKLSNIHLVSNLNAKQNLVQMGEFRKNIYIMGSPEVDTMISQSLPSIQNVKKRYAIKYNKYSIFCLHPDTNENKAKTKKNIKICISALKKINHNYIIIFPNNDENSKIILKEILTLRRLKNFKIFPSMRFEYFLTLLKNAEYIIGNSSSVVRESPVYAIPAINLGHRQKNRGHSNNIININFNEKKIIKVIKNLKKKKTKKQWLFGKGNTGSKFLKILKNKEFWKTSKEKHFNKLNINENYPFIRN